MNTQVAIAKARSGLRWPDLPIAIWMIVAALGTGWLAGLNADQALAAFNDGWGETLGDFALILLPSFALAAALERRANATAPSSAVLAGPIGAAGMVCPDTGYAALAPMAGPHRGQLAFGAYSGFKLLFPAGPLLVATGLGEEGTRALSLGVLLFLPVWAVGVLWAGRFEGTGSQPETHASAGPASWRALLPFALLVALVIAGIMSDLRSWPLLDFLTRPPGALAVSASFALAELPARERRASLDVAVTRTAALLLLIGAASALGATLVEIAPAAGRLPVSGGLAGLVSIMGVTAAFKLVQGSSMATFAAVTPIVASFITASNLPPDAIVLAVCAGSMIAVLPNDSFYWLVRKDAFTSLSETRALWALAGGTTLQGITAALGVLVLYMLGWLG